MAQSIINVSLVVDDYQDALEFFIQKLRFELIEDAVVPQQNKRWIVIAPPGSKATRIILSKASNSKQKQIIGNQAGGRVFLSLSTDNFWRDYNEMVSKGIKFVRQPKEEEYGIVAVFEDLYGNLWDLIQYRKQV